MVGKFPEGIDPSLIHLTGTIVTWWGRIEGCLIYDLMTLRNLAMNAAYVAKEPFPVSTGKVIKQWSRLQRAFSANDPQRLEKMTKLADELHEVSDDRNVLVHYFWPYGASDPSKPIKLQSVKPKRGDNNILQFTSVEITVEKLDSVNERLVRLYHRIMMETMNLILTVNRDGRPAPTDRRVEISASSSLQSLAPSQKEAEQPRDNEE
jgi:hypothetical protein